MAKQEHRIGELQRLFTQAEFDWLVKQPAFLAIMATPSDPDWQLNVLRTGMRLLEEHSEQWTPKPNGHYDPLHDPDSTQTGGHL